MGWSDEEVESDSTVLVLGPGTGALLGFCESETEDSTGAACPELGTGAGCPELGIGAGCPELGTGAGCPELGTGAGDPEPETWEIVTVVCPGDGCSVTGTDLVEMVSSGTVSN